MIGNLINKKKCEYCKKTFKHYLTAYTSLDNKYACKNCAKKERYKILITTHNQKECERCGMIRYYPKGAEVLDICTQCEEKHKKQITEYDARKRREAYRKDQLSLFAKKLGISDYDLESLIEFIRWY